MPAKPGMTRRRPVKRTPAGSRRRELYPRRVNATQGRVRGVDRKDNCVNIYRRSLLYLVSNAFEHNRGTPILGMETFFENRPSLTRQHPRRASVWDCIAAPTTSPDITRRSNSTSHGGFDDAEDTRLAVVERIARRQNVIASVIKRKRR